MKKTFFLAAVMIVSLALAACSSQRVDANLLTLSDSGKITPLQDLSYDWGDINIEGGKVSKVFEFKNEGEDDLILKTIQTSCMCTVAQITLSDETVSPEFGMHEVVKWGGIVKPGEQFKVDVVFDPLAHGPEAVGPIQREIYFLTSSLDNGNYAKKVDGSGTDRVTVLKVAGNVLAKKDYEAKAASKPTSDASTAKDLSGFFFSETEYDFGVVKQSGGVVSYDFNFIYQGNEDITVDSLPTSCSCTTAELSKKRFKKGEKGVLTVFFDPNLHEEPEGKFFKTVTMMTVPQLNPKPELKIWAQMDLDLGPEAYKLKEHQD